MESENRSYRRSGSELFICFTSRNSSSIKVCSKSAQSPGRNSGKFSNNSSLSCSLSRRLRSNGSIKGSPMFPTGGGSQKKKGGSSSETTTAEPSSPKVTCIGQVRVKTKKQGQKFRNKKSKRRDVSFRKTDQDGGNFHSSQQLQQQQECLPHRNQRWVHLPLSICEALRAFGSEFSCLLPCKPSCLTRGGGGMKKRRQTSSTERNTSSCRQTFEKWVMTSLHESDHLQNSHNNDTELVVSRREEMVGEIEMHISEEKRVSICNEVEAEQEDEEEDGRVSICIPPRNALLLMRCRSEPLRMSALAHHFWESPVKDKKEELDLQRRKQVLVAEEEDDEDDSGSDSDEEELQDGDEEKDSDDDDEVEDVSEVKLQLKHPKEENTDISLEEQNDEDYAEEMVVKKIEEDVNETGFSSIEPLKEEEEKEQEILKIEENEGELRSQMPEEEKELVTELKEERIESRRPSTSSRRVSFSSCTRSIHEDDEQENEEGEEEEQCPEAEPVKVDGFEEKVNNATEEKASKPRISVEKRGSVKINSRNDNEEEEELPDCLLLMMCEPKLSMEVSKETWVCSTDFIRYRPERRVVQNNSGGGDNLPTKKRNSTDSKGRHSLDSKSRLSTDSKSRLSTDSNPGNGRPPLHSKHQKPPTPPRRSISKPTPPPSVAKSTTPVPPPPPAKLVPPVEVSTSPSSAMVTVIEQKLVNATAYEPLVLTRCKSEPMRSSAKLAPEACFWKNMKLEPNAQGPPNLGVGATGIGF